METISIRNPWAWWMGKGWKTIEARTHSKFWKLSGRRIAIHAGKFIDKKAFRIALPYLTDQQMQESIMSFDEALKKPMRKEFDDPRFGAVLFTADFMFHRRLVPEESQEALCDCTGLYGATISNIKMLDKPIPWKGSINIFHVPNSLLGV